MADSPEAQPYVPEEFQNPKRSSGVWGTGLSLIGAAATLGSCVVVGHGTDLIPPLPTQTPEGLQLPTRLDIDFAQAMVSSWEDAKMGELQVEGPVTWVTATDGSDRLVTMSPLRGNLNEANPAEQYAFGQTKLKGPDGKEYILPVIVGADFTPGQKPQATAFGLLFDPARSTDKHKVYSTMTLLPGGKEFTLTPNFEFETTEGGPSGFRLQMIYKEFDAAGKVVELQITDFGVTPTGDASPVVSPTAVPETVHHYFEGFNFTSVAGAGIISLDIFPNRPATAIPQPEATATSIPTVEPSATPETYGVEVGHSENSNIIDKSGKEVPVEVLGVKVTLELVTDKSLQNRANKPIQELLFNGAYEDPMGPDVNTTKAKEAVAEGVMRGVWHAWKNNDTSRESVSFEAYMQMVAEYQAGTRPLEDVAYTVFANDLTTPDYNTELTTFDPTKPIRIVFTADKANMTTYEATNIIDDIAFGTQRNGKGELELWIHPSWDVGERTSSGLTYRLIIALMRLTWPGSQGVDTSYPRDVGEPDTYHTDIKEAMIYKFTSPVNGNVVEIGPIKSDPESSDNHNH